MSITLLTTLLVMPTATAVAPSNVVLHSTCDASSFALRIDAPNLSGTTREELVNQLGIGLVARGYGLCVAGEQERPANGIRIDELGDGSLDILVRYGGRETGRVLAPDHRSDRVAGLALAVAIEELVLVATDPTQPLPPARQASPIDETPAKPRPLLRAGIDSSSITYDSTDIGFGIGGRVDRDVLTRLRLGAGVTLRQIDGETSRDAGSARFRLIELQATAHGIALSTSVMALALGAGIGSALVRAEGLPSAGFQGNARTYGTVTARVLADIEVHLTTQQTVALRLAGGRPLVALETRTEANQPLGGLAGWELSLALAWLWSFY